MCRRRDPASAWALRCGARVNTAWQHAACTCVPCVRKAGRCLKLCQVCSEPHFAGEELQQQHEAAHQHSTRRKILGAYFS